MRLGRRCAGDCLHALGVWYVQAWSKGNTASVTRHCHRRSQTTIVREHLLVHALIQSVRNLNLNSFTFQSCLHVPYPQRVQPIPITAPNQPHHLTSSLLRAFLRASENVSGEGGDWWSWPMGVKAKGIPRVCHCESNRTPASLGYPLWVFETLLSPPWLARDETLGLYSPFPRKWISKWSTKSKSESWMVGRF